MPTLGESGARRRAMRERAEPACAGNGRLCSDSWVGRSLIPFLICPESLAVYGSDTHRKWRKR